MGEEQRDDGRGDGSSEAVGPVDAQERAAQWVVWSIRGVGAAALGRLDAGEGVADLWELDEQALARRLDASSLGTKTARRVRDRIIDGVEPAVALERERDRLPQDAQLVHLRDPGYPRRLDCLADPPAFLYVRGRVDALGGASTISVVGSRDVGVEDARRARREVQRLAEAGLVVVSGGALGVDAVAHKACLDAGRPTVSVLPAGIERPTPRSNASIFRRIVDEGGALVSEYPVGVSVRAYHFPRRNRLIAALGETTFIVRADVESGSLLTAEAAADIGRPVCALLGGLEEPLAQGCLKLVARGERGVRGADDILAWAYSDGPSDTAAAETAPSGGDSSSVNHPDLEAEAPARPLPDGLSEAAHELVERIREHARGEAMPILEVDALAETVGWEARRLQTVLLELELHGVAEKQPGRQAYRLRNVDP